MSTERITTLARRVLGERLAPLDDAAQDDLLRHVVALVEEEVARERRRCVALCRHRAELWGETPAAEAPAPPYAREEARSRRNEATYLAELLEQDPDDDDVL